MWKLIGCLNRFLAFGLLLAGSAVSNAETIAIIGTGNVGSALGPQFAKQGHQVVYGSRSPERPDVLELVRQTGNGSSAVISSEAAVSADIVVLAVPGELVAEIVRSLGDLSGKIIIDPTNPLRRNADEQFESAVATSNTEIIQAAVPDAFVVKAFSTINYLQMIDPQSTGGPISVPLVGNNVEAKATVAELVDGMGLQSIDLGRVENAKYVEGMLILWLNNWVDDDPPFQWYLRVPMN